MANETPGVLGTAGKAAEVAGKGLDTVNNGLSTIKWIAILATVCVVSFGGWQVYKVVTNIGGVVIDAGAAVIEGGVDGATEAIENAGEGAAEIRESVGAAVTTATEGIDTEALAERARNAGETADGAVDGTLTWLDRRRNQLNEALDGDSDTVPVPAE